MRRVNVPRMSPAHAWSALRCVGVGRLEGADFQTQQRFPIILNALFVTMFYWWVAVRRWQQRLVEQRPHLWCGANAQRWVLQWRLAGPDSFGSAELHSHVLDRQVAV